MHSIDYAAIKNNALFFRALVGEKKLCCVVKSDAYGHDLEKCCSVLQNLAHCFAVSNVSEAKKCLFFNKDILILIPLDEIDTVWAIDKNCILTADSLSTLLLIEKCAKMLNKRARIHIKIDTGMNRLGMVFDQLRQFVLCVDPSIKVEGVFSHFYDCTESSCDKQLEAFRKCADYLQSQFDYPIIKHIANTWATARSPKYHLDMVRVGIGLYGYGASGLSVAKKVWGRIIATKAVKKGDSIGYDGRYVASADCQIAVIDMGYSNGLQRVLTGCSLWVEDAPCQVVGNISMSMCTIDVTNANAHIGDKVFLITEEKYLTNDSVIIYEMLCNLQ